MYELSCTASGRSRSIQAFSPARRRKLQAENMHLSKGMQFTQSNGFPMLLPYNGRTDFDFQPYSAHNRLDGKGQALHFFEEDYKFSRPTWQHLERTTLRTISRFEAVMTPDHSLYMDRSVSQNKWHTYMSRFAGAFWQLRGYQVIPTASWAGEESFPWCFEGLPQGSVIAVCGTGIDKEPQMARYWAHALRELERQLSPTLIIVYGEERVVRGLHTPLQFIPTYVRKKFGEKKKPYITIEELPVNELWPRDIALFGEMAGKYTSTAERTFFETLHEKMLREYAPCGDLLVSSKKNEDGLYFEREEYDEYVVGIHKSDGRWKYEHVMSLHEVLALNLGELGYIDRSLTLLEWLRERNYQGVMYDHNNAYV